LIVKSSNEFDTFVLFVSYLGLGKENFSLDREHRKIGGRPIIVLLGLERHDDLVLGSRQELEGGKTVGGQQGSHVGHFDVLERCVGRD